MDEIENELASLVRSVLNLSDDVDLENAAYGETESWDSLRHIELSIKVQKVFGIQLSTEEIVNTRSYPQLRALIKNKV